MKIVDVLKQSVFCAKRMSAWARTLALAGLLVGAACGTFGAEVTGEQAQSAACRWVSRGGTLGCSFRSSADEVRTHQENGAKFHVVRLSGGGFVVMSADTRLEPVLAFSSAADLPPGSPLLALLEKDVAARLSCLAKEQKPMLLAKAASSNEAQTPEERKWAELLERPRLMAAQGTTGMEIVSDIRVEPMLKSRWSQEDYRNYGWKSEDDYCYNYYTPEHAPCGCVATAGAQIMRYFEWPKQAIGTTSYTCTYNGASRTLQLSGTAYRWGDMPLVPAEGVTLAQRQAIGRLTADIGIACGMSYTADWGSTGFYMLSRVMTAEFGYANAVAYLFKSGYDASLVNRAVLSNLDAGLPVLISISGNGGHAVVGDGYGYSNETLYYHINMGWAEMYDAWYAPPNIREFSVIDGLVYNIYTSGDRDSSICSGRVLDAAGAPIAGATVVAKKNGQLKKTVTTNAKGIYALILPAGQYEIVATSSGNSASRSLTLSQCVSLNVCEPGSGYYGQYWLSPMPVVGNLCEQDIQLTGVSGVLAPVISPDAQAFYPSVTVSIACETPGATIRYTLDGSDPTEMSTVYAEPITLTESATVKAAAWKTGINRSAISAVEYTVNPPSITWYTDKNTAMNDAKSQGKRVFMVCGRTTCPNTMNVRSLCENDPSVRKLIVEGYVPWFCDCDKQGLDWWPYATGLDEVSLPFCSIIDPDEPNAYLVRSMGPLGVADLMTMLGQYKPGSSVRETPHAVTYAWLDEYFPSSGRTPEGYVELERLDSDGDGYLNWQEYFCGTNPLDADSKLMLNIRIVNGQINLSYNANLPVAAVQKGARAVLLGSNDLKNWLDAESISARFFKIVIELPTP